MLSNELSDLVAAISADNPHWASQQLKEWDENDFRSKEPFAIEKYWSSQHSINVFEVAGTAHPDYQGMSWLDFLSKGKRMKQNLLLQQNNPGYYLDETVKQPTMYYIEIDNSGWYINGDGNHRTCIARFMFHRMGRTMLHGVCVESYRTDFEALKAFRLLRAVAAVNQLPFVIEPKRKTLSREDTAGWMRERYEIKICVHDLQKGTSEDLSPAEATARAERIEQKKTGLGALLSRMIFGRNGN